jgi:hypothetical protein
MSSATVTREFYEAAVEQYERRLRRAEETIQDLKDDINSREKAKKAKAKATEHFRRMAVSEIQKRAKKIQGLRVIHRALFSIVHTNDAKIEKLERELRSRDTTIDYLESKLLKEDESLESSESEDEAGNAA